MASSLAKKRRMCLKTPESIDLTVKSIRKLCLSRGRRTSLKNARRNSIEECAATFMRDEKKAPILFSEPGSLFREEVLWGGNQSIVTLSMQERQPLAKKVLIRGDTGAVHVALLQGTDRMELRVCAKDLH